LAEKTSALPHTDARFLTRREIDAILARPLIARLATVGGDQPHVAPVWFWWDGTSLFMETDSSFRKARNLVANPRCAVTIDDTLGGLRFWGIVMQGPASLIAEPREQIIEIVERIYRKYLGPEGIQAPAPQRMIHEGDHRIIKLTPGKIVTWNDTGSDLASMGQASEPHGS
jgi:nitroimidazol reductase NimA-like FMN-containing flavoprotein (pyridoxamine 5'-phosphate oxidase superfamily)